MLNRPRPLLVLLVLAALAVVAWILIQGSETGGPAKGSNEGQPWGPAGEGAVGSTETPSSAAEIPGPKAAGGRRGLLPAPEESPARPSGTLVLHCWDVPADAPADGVPVQIRHRDGEWPWELLAETESGAGGIVRADLPAGAALFLQVGWHSRYEFQTLREPALQAGEERTRELRLHPAPTTTLRFLTRNPDGEPVAGARVFPLEGGEFEAVETDAGGRAEVPGATAEYSFLVGATRAGYGPAYATSYVEDGPVRELVMEPEAVLEGRLLQSDGAVAAGVEVEVSTSDGFWGVQLPVSAVSWRQHTDSAGGFRFAGLRPGIGYRIAARSGPWMLERILPPPPSGRSWLELRLHAGCGIDGIALDEDRRPVAGVEVEARRIVALQRADQEGPAAFLTGFEPVRRTTGAAGSFRWSGLEPGPWRLGLAGATGGGWRSSSTGSEVADGFLADPVAVDLRPGQTHKAVLRLRRGLRIQGLLVDADGRPLVAGVVFADAENRGPGRGAVTRRIGADGAFAVGPLEAGSYRLRGEDAAGVAAGERSGVEAGSIGVLLEVRADAPIAGLVVGPAGRPRRARVVVSIRSIEDPEMWFPQTDGGGRFEISPSRAGVWDLIAATEDGMVAARGGLRTRAGRRTELTLRLQPGAAVRWELPAGAEEGRARVRVGGELLYDGVAGYLSGIRALPEGELELEIASTGGQVFRSRIWIQAGTETPVHPVAATAGAGG